jgi:recombination protein RecR
LRTPPPIERLVAALRTLPGIGEKSATRLAFHLLGKPEAQVRELAEAMLRLKQEIVLCEICFDLTEASPCALCSDERRDPKILCIVEEPADRASVERTGRFPGRYFVLGGALSPIDGVGPARVRGPRDRGSRSRQPPGSLTPLPSRRPGDRPIPPAAWETRLPCAVIAG